MNTTVLGMNFAAATPEYCCGEIAAIKTAQKKPLTRVEEARKLLEKLHAEVKPLMRKYRWRVGKLTEFVPKDKNLLGLNVNSGAKICIRLRLPDDLTTFFPWEHIVGTMLHELTHNNIAPHNDKFYKLLDHLWEEYEALKDGTRVSGVTLQGFEGKGKQLGSTSGPKDPISKRQAICAAAARRAQLGQIMCHGGQRLGGAGSKLTPTTLRRRAVDAAERRRRDALSCGVRTEHEKEANSGFARVSDSARRDERSSLYLPNSTLNSRKRNRSKKPVKISALLDETNIATVDRTAHFTKRKKIQIINDEEVAKQLHRALNRADAGQSMEKGNNSTRDGPHASSADNRSYSQSSAKRSSEEEIEVIDLT